MRLTALARSILYKAAFRVPTKSIMTTSKSMQQVLEDLEKNPYFDKYSKKIAQLRKEDPESFKERLEQAGKTKTKKMAPPKERQYSQLLTPKEKLQEPAQVKHETLDKVMKTDLIEDKTAEEIKSIWEQYHIKKDHCIAATIPTADFEKLTTNAQQYPTFLFALPRSQGFEFIMCQFTQNTVHFTPLLYFQVHKENAPECLTITHYDELKHSKGIVLMRGEYDTNVLDAKEAQCLANQLQMYYVQEDPEKLKLLETFNKKPDEFKHMDLIKQIETLSIK